MKNLLPVFAGLALSINAVAAYADEQPPAAAPAAPSSAAVTPRKAEPTPDLMKTPTLYVVGYAHLDTQWRWTYQDSIREYLPKTLHDNFALFEKYPSYVFNFSGSRRYQMMKEYYPADYEKMKAYIKAGRWFPCGSSVDENDANVPSAESYVRHVLYGNKYFRQEFGVASDEYMLPDCFGFPASLPELLLHCGVKGFSTQKLTWNAVVPIPFKVGMWEGPNGQSIAAALDPGSYSAEVRENLANSKSWADRIQRNADKSGVHVDYHYYGTGDTGGAPTERSVKAVEEAVHTNGQVKVISSAADEMFNALTPEMKKKLPTYKGELMLTQHSSGAVTSEAYMKRWNRKNELLADAAEKASLGAWWLGGRPYPGQKLEDAWYLVLGSQMHDILPGTSVPHAYDLAWNDEVLAGNQFGEVLTDASSAVVSAIDTRGEGTAIVVYNSLSFEREDVVEASVPVTGSPKGVKVTGPDGKTVAAQVLSVENGVAKVAFVAKVASVSYSAFNVEFTAEAQAGASSLKVSDHELENDSYIVKLDANGDVSSVFDKVAKKELLSAPIRLGLHYENPHDWPAWNQDWSDRQLATKSYAGSPTEFKVVENGPARIAVEVTRTAEGSTFVQRVRLASGGGGQRLEFDTDIDWRSRERSLRVQFPLTVSNPTATYDLAVGAIERGNGHEKQYEYSFHHWFDLTDARHDYGVTAMCDSKYGTDKPDDHTIRLTLLHTPGTRGGYPDQGSQDLGRHHVLFALYGHEGDWRQSITPAQGARLNQPLIAFQTGKHEGTLGKSYSLMHVSDPHVSISAAKKAEVGDEVIVRLREHMGTAASGVHLALGLPIVSAREVDGQERPLGAATVTNGELVTDLRGFDLRAFAVKLGPAPAKVAKGESKPITLTFDTDAVSTDAKPTDGAMESGKAFPAEMLPKTLTSEGVAFNFGSTADGAKNAVSCNGQTINVPEGGFDRLYILAAANVDTASTIAIDGKTSPWSVQAWDGFIGQWDRRIWPDESKPASEIVGLEPGYVKSDPVAWFSSHYHTKDGNTFYEYCYLYKYAIELPAGAKTVTLPNAPGIKVFAATAVKSDGVGRVLAAAPLFDTLSDHKQDAPKIVPASGSFADATEVRVQPNMYFRAGAIHYTTDGSEPTAQSPLYAGPITLTKAAVLKAAVLGRDGKMSGSAQADLKVDDQTPPSVKSVEAGYQSPTVRVEFSEAVGASAATTSNYAVDPSIGITKAEVQPDGKSVVLTLAKAPEMNHAYKLTVSGVADSSPNANKMKSADAQFTVAGPVYTLASMTAEQKGKTLRNITGLPVKGRDKWTMNMFVKIAKQMPNRTVIAGFGKCDDGTAEGGARYFAKFGGGAHFWSRNEDVESHTQLDLNRWQMLTATYDGTTLKLYKDGKKIGEGTPVFSDDENSVSLAPMDPWEHMRQFDGEMRNFTIWNSALGENAIQALNKTAPK